MDVIKTHTVIFCHNITYHLWLKIMAPYESGARKVVLPVVDSNENIFLIFGGSCINIKDAIETNAFFVFYGQVPNNMTFLNVLWDHDINVFIIYVHFFHQSTKGDVVHATEMAQKNVLYLANSWSDYTDQAIQGDMVAGVLNGNWIIPTMKKVEANSGKWVVTNMPTINGGGGYASNGGSSLYITGNCKNVDLAKDFLAKTFGSSTEVYDQALTNGGVISCYAPAASSEIYGQGDDFFGGQSVYADIVEMGTHVATIEQNDFHYSARKFLATAIINVVQGGADLDAAIQEAQDQLKFEMGI